MGEDDAFNGMLSFELEWWLAFILFAISLILYNNFIVDEAYLLMEFGIGNWVWRGMPHYLSGGQVLRTNGTEGSSTAAILDDALYLGAAFPNDLTGVSFVTTVLVRNVKVRILLILLTSSS